MTGSEQNGSRVVLCICALGYENNTVPDLMRLMVYNYLHGFVTIDSTVITMARNEAIRAAYKSFPDFTHILFVDSDMSGFGVESIMELVEADCDVISAMVTMRKPPYQLVASFKDEKSEHIINWVRDKKVVETKHVGMAFTLIKKDVLDRTREQTVDGDVWFTNDRDPRDTFFPTEVPEFVDTLADINEPIQNKIEKAILFGLSAHVGTRYYGEDISFCNRLQQFNIPRHIHCGVIVGHIGSRPFNVMDMIKFRKEQEKWEPKLAMP